MVNFYVLDGCGNTALVMVSNSSGDVTFEVATEKTSLKDIVMASKFIYLNDLRESFEKNLRICKIPSYPELLMDAIDFINRENGTIGFKGSMIEKCSDSSNIVVFQRGKP